MDKKDEIILQQLDVIRTMTQNNLNRMGSDFWGAPLTPDAPKSAVPKEVAPKANAPKSADGAKPNKPAASTGADEKKEEEAPLPPPEKIEDLKKELDTYIPDGKGRRMLETYNPIVLPIEKNIQVLTTASDVIHAWAIPAFGAKKDAVPGRTNETWFRVTEPGIYYGQCSEICGIEHAAMPISAYAVTEEEFTSWIACMKGDGASADYPARACVQKLGFDKYRSKQKGHTVTSANTETTTGAAE